jgi:tripartite-type tricarboxylate transporter receptor subunit TctC
MVLPWAVPLFTLAALGAPALVRSAAAQDLAPCRPVTLVVPSVAGGTTDFGLPGYNRLEERYAVA